MNFLEEWFEQAREVVFSPTEFYREAERHEGFRYPLKFAALSLFISGLLSGLVAVVTGSLVPALSGSPLGIVFSALGAVVGGIIGLFVGAALIHIFVYLFGGRGYQGTFEALSYATAVSAFFGWIPFINILAGLYTIYVQARGIENFHEMSFGKALAAVLLPVLVILGVAILVALVVGAALLTATGPTVG